MNRPYSIPRSVSPRGHAKRIPVMRRTIAVALALAFLLVPVTPHSAEAQGLAKVTINHKCRTITVGLAALPA